MFGGRIGFWELLIVLGILLLLFGATKLPQLARGLGKSISEFKKGLKEEETENKKEEGK
ncbi:MAG: twin-arginine translocase TatA/TatE family subunit [Planctomycetota bacterium]